MRQLVLIRPYHLGTYRTFRNTTMNELGLRQRSFGVQELLIGDEWRMHKMARLLKSHLDIGHYLVSSNLLSADTGTKQYYDGYETLELVAGRCETLIAVLSCEVIFSLGNTLAENHLGYFQGIPDISAGEAVLITRQRGRILSPRAKLRAVS